MTKVTEPPAAVAEGQKTIVAKPKRVLVLVLSFDKDPYRTVEVQGQRSTWAASQIPDVPVLFYYGVTSGLSYWLVAVISRTLHAIGRGPRNAFLRRVAAGSTLHARETGDRIDVDLPDFYGTIGAKMIGAFRHVLAAHSFDFIFRTNTSSYVYLPLLRQFVQSLPERGYYAGVIGEIPNLTFAGGAGILLSRDLVEFAANDPAWDWDLMDDVALARSMVRAGVAPRPLARITLDVPEKVALVPPDQWRTCFHVRCQSSDNRLRDIEIMNLVHASYLAAWRD